MTCGIYMITTPSGDRYVGQSKNIEARWKTHKYGSFENKFEVLEECSPTELESREWHWISTINPELNVLVPQFKVGSAMVWTHRKEEKQAKSQQPVVSDPAPLSLQSKKMYCNMSQLRERKKLRLIDVAYHLNVTETTVRNWEHGRSEPKLSFEQTVKLMELYGCSIEDLQQAFQETVASV